jgi:hypothetical protein
MTYRGTGKATVDINSPRAFGTCDRCSAWRNMVDLVPQIIYAGANLFATNLLVCKERERCNDLENPQTKAILIPPDPYPTVPSRPEFFAYSENPNNPPVTVQDILDALNADSGGT